MSGFVANGFDLAALAQGELIREGRFVPWPSDQPIILGLDELARDWRLVMQARDAGRDDIPPGHRFADDMDDGEVRAEFIRDCSTRWYPELYATTLWLHRYRPIHWRSEEAAP